MNYQPSYHDPVTSSLLGLANSEKDILRNERDKARAAVARLEADWEACRQDTTDLSARLTEAETSLTARGRLLEVTRAHLRTEMDTTAALRTDRQRRDEARAQRDKAQAATSTALDHVRTLQDQRDKLLKDLRSACKERDQVIRERDSAYIRIGSLEGLTRQDTKEMKEAQAAAATPYQRAQAARGHTTHVHGPFFQHDPAARLQGVQPGPATLDEAGDYLQAEVTQQPHRCPAVDVEEYWLDQTDNVHRRMLFCEDHPRYHVVKEVGPLGLPEGWGYYTPTVSKWVSLPGWSQQQALAAAHSRATKEAQKDDPSPVEGEVYLRLEPHLPHLPEVAVYAAPLPPRAEGYTRVGWLSPDQAEEYL